MTPWTVAYQASLSFTISQSLLKLKSIESVMPSNYLILWHPLLLLPSIFPSIRIFSNKSTLHIRWSKYCSFSFSISPSNEYSGLISFRIDWLCLLSVQETLKSLLQHHSTKHHFFSTQPSLWFNSFIHTWWLEKHSFDYIDLVGKVMSLYFPPSRYVIAFLPRNKCLLNFVTTVTICSDFEVQENKVSLLSMFPIYLSWSKGTGFPWF